jgi:anti-sigma-K factor RskA
MIDERNEELAALYSVDLLEGAEKVQFEAALARDPELQALVREVRVASASLAHSVSVTPPTALRDRVLSSIGTRPVVAPAPVPATNVIRPPASFWQFAPWAIAAGFAVVAAWSGQRYLATSSELALIRDREALAEITVQSTRQQLEAERIVTVRERQDLQQQIAATTNQLQSVQTQLAAFSPQLAERESQIAALSQRVDALAGASADLTRQLGEEKNRVAKLTEDMRVQLDLTNYKITILASIAQNSPEALAAAVWNPANQEGVLKVEKLPALLPSQDYQLWVVDPQYENPVDGGVFTVDPQTGEARFTFKPNQPVKAVAAFAVTLERKGGVPKAEGPFVLLGK